MKEPERQDSATEDDPQRLLESLMQAASESQRLDLADEVPTEYLKLMLKSFSPLETLCRIERMKAALKELQEMEQAADTVKLQRLFESGNIMTRGKGKVNGAPILWTRTCRGYEGEGGCDEYLLEWFWVLIHARQGQMANGEPDVIFVFDDFGRPFLDFSISMLSKFGKLCSDLFPIAQNSGQYTFCANRFQETVLDTLLKLSPASYRENNFTKFNRKEVLDIVSDPADLPTFFDQAGSEPFQCNFDTVGDMGLVLEKKGFAGLSLRCIYGASPNEVELSREKSSHRFLKIERLSICELSDDTFDSYHESFGGLKSFKSLRRARSQYKSPMSPLPNESGEANFWS